MSSFFPYYKNNAYLLQIILINLKYKEAFKKESLIQIPPLRDHLVNVLVDSFVGVFPLMKSICPGNTLIDFQKLKWNCLVT